MYFLIVHKEELCIKQFKFGQDISKSYRSINNQILKQRKMYNIIIVYDFNENQFFKLPLNII